jgi:hypothetical protein
MQGRGKDEDREQSEPSRRWYEYRQRRVRLLKLKGDGFVAAKSNLTDLKPSKQ